MSNDRVCLIFGSGATRGSGLSFIKNAKTTLKNQGIELTNGKIPMDSDFWDCVEVSQEFFPALTLLRKRKLNCLKSMEKTWSLTNLVHQKGQDFISDSVIWEALNPFKDWPFKHIFELYGFFNDMEDQYIKQNQRAPFNINRHDSSPHYFCGDIDTEWRSLIYLIYKCGNFDLTNNGTNQYAKLFYELRSRNLNFDIISFNYDLLAENTLEGKYTYVSENGESCSSEKLAAFVKLHGSLNWLQKAREPVQFKKKEVEPKYNNGSVWFEQPAMVPPTFNKVEVNRPEDDPNRYDSVRRIIDKQWEFAKNILQKSLGWIFIGYGFPDTDEHARKLFKGSYDKTSGEKPKIHYCTYNSCDREYVKIKNIFSEGVKIECFRKGFKDFTGNDLGRILDSLNSSRT